MTDRKALAPESAAAEQLLGVIHRVIAAGVDWIQIREKDLPARELMHLTREAVAASTGMRTRILVNDRLDVALAARASGVHLGGESLPVRVVTAWRDGQNATVKNFLVGASCHSLSQAQFAEREGADYVIFGPVFATPSKMSFGPPQGIPRLREVCGQVRIRVFAIGGINAENTAECLRAGAAGVAAIRMFQEAGTVEELKAIVDRIRSVNRS